MRLSSGRWRLPHLEILWWLLRCPRFLTVEGQRRIGRELESTLLLFVILRRPWLLCSVWQGSVEHEYLIRVWDIWALKNCKYFCGFIFMFSFRFRSQSYEQFGGIIACVRRSAFSSDRFSSVDGLGG
ncbi:hypothetical protein M569_15870 [Genlisea aurea]|uniref:Rab-GAP TBC domain-containing protein n=1 Tax=Genlisea aurea TaxID=192259 RepID=S8D8D6_9LAMI|nr:hypothetical protein M569_15870 [Genlisea aurea]